MAQLAQKGDGHSIPGNIQGQFGCRSEHPVQVGDVPACGRRLDWINLNGLSPTILLFCSQENQGGELNPPGAERRWWEEGQTGVHGCGK